MKQDILYYNPNESRSGVPALLGKQAEAEPLALDYGWLDKDSMLLLLERKELTNLASDLRNNHLRDQLEAAKKLTPHVWLLTEGDLEATIIGPTGYLNLPGEWHYDLFWGALMALLFGLQVSGPLFSNNKEETAILLKTLFRQTCRGFLGSGRPVIPKWRPTTHGTMAESYARAIKGLGFQRAVALQKQFPSWVHLVEATVADLKKIQGIGPIMAGRIHGGLRKEV